MTTDLKNDGSEDVNDFLRRIRELDEKRNREDDERTKKLEEEILKGRQERQARRAERARSISPMKDSPSYTPLSLRSAGSITPVSDITMLPPMDPAKVLESNPKGLAIHGIGLSGGESPSMTEDSSRQVTPSRETSIESENPTASSRMSPSAAIAPSRQPTLSWQRRPDPTQPGRSRARPMSAMNLGSLTPMLSKSKTMPDITSPEEKEPSRAEITQSLQLKDPSWFRQTEDRGVSSPAYRRTPAERTMDATSTWSRTRLPLPGMTDGGTERASRKSYSPPVSVRSISPSRESSTRDSVNLAYNYSSNTSISGAPLTKMGFQRGTVSPEPTATNASTQSEQTPLDRNPAMSPSQGRLGADRLERPVSPTKGLGGFVQSAMMKRSDSVQKRWSAQPNFGLSRENSVMSKSGFGRAGSVPTFSGTPGSPPRPETRLHTDSQRSSTESEIGVQAQGTQSSIDEPEKASNDDKKQTPSPQVHTSGEEASGKIARHSQSRSESITNVEKDEQKQVGISRQTVMTPPTSPSKGVDPKRWSPSKASWLESALNKTSESPKLRSPVVQQPSWMSAINKAKQQETTPNHGSVRGFQEVKTGGLMRAPPPGLSKPNFAYSTPNQSSPTSIGKHRTPRSDENDAGSATRLKSPPPIIAKSPELTSKLLPASEASEDSVASEPAEQKIGSSSNSIEASPVPSSIKSEPLMTTTTKPPPLATKSKPPTPPKKDFRSVLKSRQALENNSQQEEPEFKNVFSNLRRTTTQKYVAPNELKDNILRGKAGLSVTGGPIKAERKDELKESLLRQKDALKAKSNVQKPQTPPKPTSAAISRKDQSFVKVGGSGRGVDDTAIRTDASEGGKESSEISTAVTRPQVSDKPRLDLGTKLAAPSVPTSNKEPVPDTGVAHKFNARLAQMIARGPPPSMASKDDNVIQSTSTTQPQSSSVDGNKPPEIIGASGPLTHMTKGRARGPKRRPPVSNKDDGRMTASSSTEDKSNTLVQDKSKVSVSSSKISSENQRTKPSSSLEGAADGEKLTTSDHGLQESNAQSILADAGRDLSIDTAPSQSTKLEEISVLVQPFIPAPNVSSSEPSAHQGLPSARAGSRDNVPKDGHSDKLTTVSPALDTRPEFVSRVIPRPLHLPIKEQTSSASNRSITKSASQPTVHLEESSSTKSKLATTTTVEADSPDALAVRDLFMDFFGDISKSPSTINVDTKGNLSANSNAVSAAKTIRKQIWEITGDGKEQQVPPHQEHILFEDKMYICTHVLEASGGAKHTEVYFWAGDVVSDAAVEDAQLFARKVARDNDGKLIKIRQGREPPNFFQALGGILVTRRGPSFRVDSNTPYMLCGRRHLGHIAFDEVDFSLDSLCSGFPYIISSPPRKTYLWKGRGSATDELGCARLIAMDVGLAGDLEEVDEGNEPAAFLDAFEPRLPRRIPESADYWRLKPSHDGYCARLFRIDHHQAESSKVRLFWSRRQSAEDLYRAQISELRPFCQSDLDPTRIHLLDAFFEIYVIVGDQAQDKYAQFRSALTLAQEFGQTSIENRPFVPVASVVLGGGLTRDMKAVFRKWRDTPYTRLESSSAKVVPLNVAIDASR
ncbi:MAG: hypothetical protein M1816_001578 [Peltula sp. TS41687]|nr:MAG: hypothetical protein M1816_001578 [Peltula sp. TS41687]